jgi:hypothetical protein
MNWGNKLLFTFIVFAAGMFYLVYRSMHTTYELVEKDYYKTELRYQQVIDGTNHANELSTAVTLDQKSGMINLTLPAEMKNKNISGNIWFYCAYDEKRDKKYKLQLNADAMQTFGLAAIMPGNYTVKITWNNEDKTYFAEKKITVL